MPYDLKLGMVLPSDLKIGMVLLSDLQMGVFCSGTTKKREEKYLEICILSDNKAGFTELLQLCRTKPRPGLNPLWNCAAPPCQPIYSF